MATTASTCAGRRERRQSRRRSGSRSTAGGRPPRREVGRTDVRVRTRAPLVNSDARGVRCGWRSPACAHCRRPRLACCSASSCSTRGTAGATLPYVVLVLVLPRRPRGHALAVPRRRAAGRRGRRLAAEPVAVRARWCLRSGTLLPRTGPPVAPSTHPSFHTSPAASLSPCSSRQSFRVRSICSRAARALDSALSPQTTVTAGRPAQKQ